MKQLGSYQEPEYYSASGQKLSDPVSQLGLALSKFCINPPKQKQKKKTTEEIEIERIRRQKEQFKREKLRRERYFQNLMSKKKRIETGGDIWQRIRNLPAEEIQKELFKAALASGNVWGSILGVPDKKKFEPTKFEQFALSCYEQEPSQLLKESVFDSLRCEIPKVKLPFTKRDLEGLYKIQKVKPQSNIFEYQSDSWETKDKENIEYSFEFATPVKDNIAAGCVSSVDQRFNDQKVARPSNSAILSRLRKTCLKFNSDREIASITSGSNQPSVFGRQPTQKPAAPKRNFESKIPRILRS